MLTRKDVENAISQAEEILREKGQEGLEWEYWRDSGEFHVWRTTDWDWLLQVPHETERFGFTQLAENISDPAETVTIGYSSGEEGIFASVS